MDAREELNRRILAPLYVLGALEAFKKDARAVVFKEEQLKQFFELTLLRSERLDWIRRDARDLFPHCYYVYGVHGTGHVVLSRKDYGRSITPDSAAWRAMEADRPVWIDLASGESTLKRLLQELFTTILGFDGEKA